MLSLYQSITELGGVGLLESVLAIDKGVFNEIPQIVAESHFSMPDRAIVSRFFKLIRKFFLMRCGNFMSRHYL